jgi:hypothetical protein
MVPDFTGALVALVVIGLIVGVAVTLVAQWLLSHLSIGWN